MSKIIYSLLMIPFLALPLQAEGEWRWGVSLGTGSISFENEEGSADGTTGLEADYNPSIFGFDVSDGTHSVSVFKSNSGGEDVDVSFSGTSNYTFSSAEQDYDELNITYLYRLNSNWSVGATYNKVTNDFSSSKFNSINYSDALSSIAVASDPGAYTWTKAVSNDQETDGFAVVANWVKPINSQWVFAAKIGLASTDYSNSTVGSEVVTGIPAALHDQAVAAGLGNANGDGVDWSGSESGDNIASILGMSMVYIVNANNTITLTYDRRVDDFGDLSENYNQVARNGWVTAGGNLSESWEGVNEVDIEQTNSKFLVVWRYTLN